MVAVIIGSLFFILFVGFITIRREYVKFQKDNILSNEFAVTFQQAWVDKTNSHFDGVKYSWLLKNVDKIQSTMDTHIGLITYKPAGYDTFIPNYPVLTNTVNKLTTGDVYTTDYTLAINALLRHIGMLETEMNNSFTRLRNPFICFQVGFTQIASLPFYILTWFGILNPDSPKKLIRNGLYKVVVGILGLVGFISAIVTIIDGWEPTVKMYHSIFP
ncbi:hypothetical protein WSM22_03430 [Cytophagales bacterium WSM2-2]|nr:hypothetical protein WSM22_03430 [Cytophagales bacterium WSM2-2]